MALCRAVGICLKVTKPILANPCFIVPSTVNLQVRHAARKGYRNEATKKKKLQKKEKEELGKKTIKERVKLVKFERTTNLNKPEPPDDDVFIKDDFNYKKYSLSEIIGFHKEYHHPTMYNNPNAPVLLKIEINMIGKKKTQVLKPFTGVAQIPHPFVLKNRKEVLVLCPPTEVALALECGAEIAGGVDIIKKIQEGLIQPSLYNYIICHSSFLPQLTPVRGLLKDKMPRAKSGTLTNDLKQAIHRFLHGIEFSCVKYGSMEDFGCIQCSIGTVSMEVEQLEDNFKALLEAIETNRPPREGEFISWIWCTSPPSAEEFSVDLSKYLKTVELDVIDDDDKHTHVNEDLEEIIEARKLKHEYEEEKLMG